MSNLQNGKKKTSNNKKEWYVHYVYDSKCLIKVFKTKKELQLFVSEYKEIYKNKELDGYWIDFCFVGGIIEV